MTRATRMFRRFEAAARAAVATESDVEAALARCARWAMLWAKLLVKLHFAFEGGEPAAERARALRALLRELPEDAAALRASALARNATEERIVAVLVLHALRAVALPLAREEREELRARWERELFRNAPAARALLRPRSGRYPARKRRRVERDPLRAYAAAVRSVAAPQAAVAVLCDEEPSDGEDIGCSSSSSGGSESDSDSDSSDDGMFVPDGYLRSDEGSDSDSDSGSSDNEEEEESSGDDSEAGAEAQRELRELQQKQHRRGRHALSAEDLARRLGGAAEKKHHKRKRKRVAASESESES